MVEIIGVRFKKVGKVYYFDPDGLKFESGEYAIVETARGVEYGEVTTANKQVQDDEIVSPLKKVLRRATPEDAQKVEENKLKEKEAFNICLEKIKKHGLDMNLVDVEYTFDRDKVLFYFTAEGRIDFRELVKDLAAIFRTRIELRQIGVRDEAKMMGGIGVCGRPFCCSVFLGEFVPVSIKMAKDQSLSLNPAKISGSCGRLMCCLNYEQSSYEALWEKTPRQGAIVSTKTGQGRVVDVNVLKGIVRVHLDRDADGLLQIFKPEELKIIKNAYSSSDIDIEELKELEE